MSIEYWLLCEPYLPPMIWDDESQEMIYIKEDSEDIEKDK